jgi:hypothetical protein
MKVWMLSNFICRMRRLSRTVKILGILCSTADAAVAKVEPVSAPADGHLLSGVVEKRDVAYRDEVASMEGSLSSNPTEFGIVFSFGR